MKMVLYFFFLPVISPVWLSLSPTQCKQAKHPHSCTSLSFSGHFSYKIVSIASVLFFVFFTFSRTRCFINLKLFCLPKNCDSRVYKLQRYFFKGMRCAPEKGNKKELLRLKHDTTCLSFEFSQRILRRAFVFSVQMRQHTFSINVPL